MWFLGVASVKWLEVVLLRFGLLAAQSLLRKMRLAKSYLILRIRQMRHRQTANKSGRRLLFVNNIPISYRNALFAEIQSLEPGASIVFLAKTETVRREVDLSHLEGVKYEILGNIYRRKAKKSTTSDCLVNLIPISKISDAEVVVFFGYNYIANLVGALVALSLGKRTVLFCETTLQEANNGGWRFAAKRLLVPLLFERFIVPGLASKAFIQSFGVPDSRVLVAVNGAPDLGGFKELKGPLQGRNLRIGLLGRLAPEKNFEWAIRALADKPGIEIHVGGDGPLYAQLAAIPGPVLMHGHLTRGQLAAYFDLIDVLLLPSSMEPWGFVVNEALGCGCPVILSDRVGCRFEVAPGAGLVYEYGSEAELISCVSSIRDRLAEYSHSAKSLSEKITVHSQAQEIVQFLAHDYS